MGISIQRAGHPRYPFVALYQEDGCQRKKYFTSRRSASEWKARREASTAHIAPSDEPATPEEHLAVVHARKHKVPLMAAVEHWRHTAGRANGITIADLCARRQEEAARAGYSHNYNLQLAAFMRRIIKEIGAVPMAEATPEKLANFIHARGKAASQRYYRAVLSSVFACAQRASIIETNPAALVKIRKDRAVPPGIYTPEEAMRWISCVALEAPSLLAGTAIALFAGLRAAEIARLDWREVRLARGFIEVTAAKAKTRTRRLVDIADNLAVWLAPLEHESGPVWPADAARYRTKAVVAAYGGSPPRNAARHSFASYHLALWEDVAKTELQAGHDRAVLFGHYRELVTKQDAEQYFSITPA